MCSFEVFKVQKKIDKTCFLAVGKGLVIMKYKIHSQNTKNAILSITVNFYRIITVYHKVIFLNH